MNTNLESILDAIKILNEATGRDWSARQVLQAVHAKGMSLQAVTPPTATVNQSVWQKNGRRKQLAENIGRRRADLNGNDILALIDCGELFATTPAWTDADVAAARLTSQNNQYDIFLDDLHAFCAKMPADFETLMAKNADFWHEGERLQIITHLEFSEPVRVTPADVLVTQDALDRILNGVAPAKLASTQENKTIPGKMPRTGIGSVTVEAAWTLEHSLGRRPTSREVMDRLKQWATECTRPDILKAVGSDSRSVDWTTGKGKQNNFGMEALGKALETWWKSRVVAESEQKLGTTSRE